MLEVKDFNCYSKSKSKDYCNSKNHSCRNTYKIM